MSKALAVAALLAFATYAATGSSSDDACLMGTASLAPCARIATADRAAVVVIPGAPGADALEVTAKPIATDPAGAFLVEVSVNIATNGTVRFEPLGSFSFLPARVGISQTFVLPKPDVVPAGPLTLYVRLVSANASRPLGQAAVEITGARLVR